MERLRIATLLWGLSCLVQRRLLDDVARFAATPNPASSATRNPIIATRAVADWCAAEVVIRSVEGSTQTIGDVQLAFEAREALRLLADLRWHRCRVLELKVASYGCPRS